MDAECYALFSPVFTPVIAALHPAFRATPEWRHQIMVPEVDVESLHDPDPTNEFIKAVRISTGRNLVGVGLGPSMDHEERLLVLRAVDKAIGAAECFSNNDTAGRDLQYVYTEESMERDLNGMGFLPWGSPNDPQGLQVPAALKDDWPEDRGVWFEGFQMVVWVNAEEHLQVISTEEIGPDTGSPTVCHAAAVALERVSTALSQLGRQLDYETSDKLGYITTSPALLGTAMRVSLVMTGLERVSKRPDFVSLCDSLGLEVCPCPRLLMGDLMLQSKGTLGVSEAQAIRDTLTGVRKLVG
ncbi:unnamed protein product, partial [Chrysoparadoxa australica]